MLDLTIPMFLAVLSISCIIVGISFLAEYRRARKAATHVANRGFLVVGIVLLIIGSVAGGLEGYVVYAVSERSFGYHATLVPDGPGVVRVSLPMPDDGSLPALIRVEPASASVSVNRSGSEPALEITLSERTTVSASVRGLGPLPSRNLTRVQELGGCDLYTNCSAILGVDVLSGTIGSVHVDVYAGWGDACGGPVWVLIADAMPGERDYPSTWASVVC